MRVSLSFFVVLAMYLPSLHLLMLFVHPCYNKWTSNTNCHQYITCKGNRFIWKHYKEHHLQTLCLLRKDHPVPGQLGATFTWIAVALGRDVPEQACARAPYIRCHTISTNELKEQNYFSFKVPVLSSKITVRIESTSSRSAGHFPWLAQGHAGAGLALQNCWFPISYPLWETSW